MQCVQRGEQLISAFSGLIFSQRNTLNLCIYKDQTTAHSYSLFFYLERNQQHRLSELFIVEKDKMHQTLVRFSSLDQKDIFVRVLSFTYLTAQCLLTMFKLQWTSHWFLTKKPREIRQPFGYKLMHSMISGNLKFPSWRFQLELLLKSEPHQPQPQNQRCLLCASTL